MSETPKKKKAPAKKAATSKKAPAKKQGTGKRGRPPKNAAYKADAKDHDKDDLISSVVQDAVYESADEMIDALQAEALELADKLDEAVDNAIDKVVIYANDVKKKSLRDRMLKWFKKKK